MQYKLHHLIGAALSAVTCQSAHAQSLSAANVSVVPEDPAASGFLVPSKTYGILASGRPVLCIGSSESDVATIVRDADCGRVVSSEDPALLVATILELKTHPEIAAELGIRARRAAETRYDRRRAADQWTTVLERALLIG